MGFEQLSLSSFIQEMGEVTDGAHPRKFCFVLGAGASRASGIKSGQELVRIWDKDLRERNEDGYHQWRNELGINDDNMSNFYSSYYEKRFCRCPADGLNYIEKIMESAKPSIGYVMLAHLLTATPHNVVITTNFDHLTEDAVTYYAQKTPLVVGHESLAHYVTGQSVRPTIIKIHRDLLFDPKSRSEDLEKLPDSWKGALERVFENYHPVFIGYAGNDKSLMDFLVEHSEKFFADEWRFPYWLRYKTDPIDGKVKDFLEKSDGLVVPHSGFDDVMIRLGDKFGYQFPNEEQFMTDAQSRYRMLRDAIDRVSDKLSDKPRNVAGFDRRPEPLEKTGGSAEETGEAAEESKEVSQAIQRITSQSELQQKFREASVCMEEEKYTDAIGLLKQLISQDPCNARYHYTLADAYSGAEQYAEAVTEAEKAAEIDPGSELAYFTLGSAYEKTEDFEKALEAYLTTAELDPDWGLPRFCAGEMLEKLGREEAALDAYREAGELDPEWEVPPYAAGLLLEKLGRETDAIAEYQRSIELSPDWQVSYFALGMLYEKMGQAERALEEYQTTVEVDPDYHVAYFRKAKVLEKLGRHEEALDAIRKAVQLMPDCRPYCDFQSLIYQRMGLEDETRASQKLEETLKT